jgi:hypothetical protein
VARRKRYEELAQQWDKKVERGEEMEGLSRVEKAAPRHTDTIYSMRLTREEAALFRAAAVSRGVKLSEWVRAVLVEAARSESGNNQTLDEALLHLQQGGELLRRLKLASGG